MYDPLSAEERQALVRYLKTLSERLDNVVQLLQNRRTVGSASLVDLATTAQINIDAMHSEMVNLGTEHLGPHKLRLVAAKKMQKTELIRGSV